MWSLWPGREDVPPNGVQPSISSGHTSCNPAEHNCLHLGTPSYPPPPGYSNTDAVDTSEVNNLDISDTSLLLSYPYCVILCKVEELEISPGAQQHQHQFLHVIPV